jgi:vanillate O-demethylase ferredoxin subunit
MSVVDAVRPATELRAEKLTLLVRQIRLEATGVHSYELVDPAGAPLPAAPAGSHLDVHLPNGVIRQYSLCNDPAERMHYVIAVLRDDKGRGGSRAVHETMHVGEHVVVSAPRNNFPVAAEAGRHVLLAGGIGITPLKAMLHELAAADADFTLYYCAKSPAHAAFADELAAHDERVVFHYDGGDPSRGLDVATLLRDHVEGTHVYYCGPSGFMEACATASAHWPTTAVHSEHFKAPVAAVAPSIEIGTFDVEIASTGARFTIPADRSIVDVLNDAGVAIETSCVSGLCGTCKTRYLAGDVDHQDFILSEDERSDYLTTCVSRAVSPLLVLDL